MKLLRTRNSRLLRLLHDLHYILVLKNVVLADLLWLVLARCTPNPRAAIAQCQSAPHTTTGTDTVSDVLLEVVNECLVDAIAKVLDSRLHGMQDNRSAVVRDLALGLGVAAKQRQ